MASYSDNFNYTDELSNQGWVEDDGDIDADGTDAHSQNAADFNRARYNSALDSANHYVQAEVTVGEITVRQASSTFTCYAGRYAGPWESPGLFLLEITAGNYATLDSVATEETASPGTLKLIVDGASQSLEFEEVEVCSDTDATIDAGAYAGIARYGNDGVWDDWSAEDLAAVGLVKIAKGLLLGVY